MVGLQNNVEARRGLTITVLGYRNMRFLWRKPIQSIALLLEVCQQEKERVNLIQHMTANQTGKIASVEKSGVNYSVNR